MSDTGREILRSKNLDKLFTEAIANLDKVGEAQVTATYIEQQREKKIYPVTKFDKESSFGGHSNVGLKSYTRDQQKKIHKLVDELMGDI